MLTIKGHKITLTRGDSMTLKLTLKKGGDDYEIQEGDSIRFAMSKYYLGEDGYELIKEKTIPTDTLELSLSAEDTKVEPREYNYDIQMSHQDGTIDTFISSTITITKEVK